MRLYIIGNGFDIRHGLPTGYKHFKSYVAKNDQELYDSIEEYIPAGDEWNELESALGEIDYELILQNSEMFLASYNTDDWSDAYHHDYQYEVDKITRMLSARLKKQFADWVKGINIADAYNSEQYIPPYQEKVSIFHLIIQIPCSKSMPFQTSKLYIFTAIVVTMTISY